MSTIENCSSCSKAVGLFICAGCRMHFCTKDLRAHREQLDGDMIGLIGDRNDFQEEMNKINEEENSRKFLQQIDAWRETTIEKVRQVAEEVREQVMKILNSKRMNMNKQFEMFSRELVRSKDSEEYLEQDIERLKRTIRGLNDDLWQLKGQTAVELNVEQSEKIDWHRVIYVEEKTTLKAKEEHQQITTQKSKRWNHHANSRTREMISNLSNHLSSYLPNKYRLHDTMYELKYN